MPKLGVNIDHVATLRQARREFDPDPVAAAKICEKAGANSIVCHLREDRRHINDSDVRRLKKAVKIRFNLEMSLNPSIIATAASVCPDEATFVPERRQEITTEGGLDVVRYFRQVREAVTLLHKKGIKINLFVAPNEKQIIKALESGAEMIELHTGHYANAVGAKARAQEFAKIRAMTALARSLGLIVNAGHGLKYDNASAIARIKGMEELNIGHSVISRAVFVGLGKAVREIKMIVERHSYIVHRKTPRVLH